MLDSHRRRRPMRVLAYTLLGLGATILLSDPLRTMRGVGVGIRWVWSGFLLAGTLLAIYGALRDRYLAEFIGLPLLMASMAAFTAVLLAVWTSASVALACFLAAIVVIMLSRWFDLWRLTVASARAERGRV